MVTTLRKRGHELLVIGVHDDLTPIRQAVDEFKPTIAFNLMEAFADIGVFDQNVVSYLELIRVPHTGCNPRGLMLSRDKALARKLLAYHRIPSPDFTVVPINRKPVLPKKLTHADDRQVAHLRIIDRYLAGLRGCERRAAKQAGQHIHDTILTPAIIEQFIDGRELYGRDGQSSPSCVPGVGDVVCQDARQQLADRDGTGEVERQLPEAVWHRHRRGAAAQWDCPQDSASRQAHLSSPRPLGLRPYRLPDGRERQGVCD